MSFSGWQERFVAAKHPVAVIALVETYTQSLSPDDLGAMPGEVVHAMRVGHFRQASEILQRSATEFRGDPRVEEKIRLAAHVFSCADARLSELRNRGRDQDWRQKLQAAGSEAAVASLLNRYVDAIPLYNRLRLPHEGWQALTRCAAVAESASALREAAATFRGDPEIALLLGELWVVFEVAASRLRELAAR
jgi:hypothetical protein